MADTYIDVVVVEPRRPRGVTLLYQIESPKLFIMDFRNCISEVFFINKKENIMMKKQLQQGDTLYKKIEFLPDGIKEVKRKNGAIIIAEGEATGHAHRIFDVEAMFFEKDGKFYLKNEKSVTVKHEEHNPITIDPGIWEIGQVREKDWITGMVRKVID